MTAPAGQGRNCDESPGNCWCRAELIARGNGITPAIAADMTFERALNVAKEPQNWLIHHGNYEAHRFSGLKEINTDNVKNLRVVFTFAMGGFEGGGRYKFGSLEGTPLVEDGIMYVPDGWGRSTPSTSPAARRA